MSVIWAQLTSAQLFNRRPFIWMLLLLLLRSLMFLWQLDLDKCPFTGLGCKNCSVCVVTTQPWVDADGFITCRWQSVRQRAALHHTDISQKDLMDGVEICCRCSCFPLDWVEKHFWFLVSHPAHGQTPLFLFIPAFILWPRTEKELEKKKKIRSKLLNVKL